MKTAIYPGTFDPITNGHLDVINKALLFIDKLIVALPETPAKKPFFSLSKRMRFIRESTKGKSVDVVSFSGLLSDFAKTKKCSLIVKGVRGSADLDYELQMAYQNARLNPKLQTLFIPPSEQYSHLSSTLVKELASFRHKESLSSMVPRCVEKALLDRLDFS